MKWFFLKAEFWWWWWGGWLAWPSSPSPGIKLWKIIVRWKLKKKCKASRYAGRYTLPTRKFQQELIMNLHGSMRENCHVSIDQIISSNIFFFPYFSFDAYIFQKLKSNWMEFSCCLLPCIMFKVFKMWFLREKYSFKNILLFYIFFSAPLPSYPLPFYHLPCSPYSQFTQKILPWENVFLI